MAASKECSWVLEQDVWFGKETAQTELFHWGFCTITPFDKGDVSFKMTDMTVGGEESVTDAVMSVSPGNHENILCVITRSSTFFLWFQSRVERDGWYESLQQFLPEGQRQTSLGMAPLRRPTTAPVGSREGDSEGPSPVGHTIRSNAHNSSPSALQQIFLDGFSKVGSTHRMRQTRAEGSAPYHNTDYDPKLQESEVAYKCLNTLTGLQEASSKQSSADFGEIYDDVATENQQPGSLPPQSQEYGTDYEVLDFSGGQPSQSEEDEEDGDYEVIPDVTNNERSPTIPRLPPKKEARSPPEPLPKATAPKDQPKGLPPTPPPKAFAATPPTKAPAPMPPPKGLPPTPPPKAAAPTPPPKATAPKAQPKALPPTPPPKAAAPTPPPKATAPKAQPKALPPTPPPKAISPTPPTKATAPMPPPKVLPPTPTATAPKLPPKPNAPMPPPKATAPTPSTKATTPTSPTIATAPTPPPKSTPGPPKKPLKKPGAPPMLPPKPESGQRKGRRHSDFTDSRATDQLLREMRTKERARNRGSSLGSLDESGAEFQAHTDADDHASLRKALLPMKSSQPARDIASNHDDSRHVPAAQPLPYTGVMGEGHASQVRLELDQRVGKERNPPPEPPLKYKPTGVEPSTCTQKADDIGSPPPSPDGRVKVDVWIPTVLCAAGSVTFKTQYSAVIVERTRLWDYLKVGDQVLTIGGIDVETAGVNFVTDCFKRVCSQKVHMQVLRSQDAKHSR